MEKVGRHYGLKVGDRVKYPMLSGFSNNYYGQVVGLASMDNNRVFVKRDSDGKVVDCVAEWCEKVVPRLTDMDVKE